jgi:glutamate racemase
MRMDPRPLGVFDSGIGGLTVVRELLRILPHEELVYYGDVARLPYGNKSPQTVTRFSREICKFLLERGVKAIVVACNTASALALPALEAELPVPVVGVIDAGAQAAARSTSGKVGVVATASTVKSGAYTRAIRALRPDETVIERACPLFVPLVEEGWIDHPVTREVAREYLEPLTGHELDTLILGCTHYPLLKHVIGEVMGPQVRLVDSGEQAAHAVHALLEERGLAAPPDVTPPGHAIYLSDRPDAFTQTAERFLGRALPPVEVVTVAG